MQISIPDVTSYLHLHYKSIDAFLGLFIINGILEFFTLTRAIEHKQHFFRWEQSNCGVAKSFWPRYLKALYFIFPGTQTNLNTMPTSVLRHQPKRSGKQ